jgi:hypothetical protein
LVRLQRVFESGSHKKRTLVAPLSGTKFAIDMVALLSSELYDSYSMREGGQSQLLQHFRGALSTFPEYSRTTIKGNGQAVTLLLAEFDIDVVPAFSLTRGGYFIPDSRNGGTWIATYPEEQEALLNSRNSQYSFTLKPLIKFIKSWAKAQRVPLSGFMVETLVSNYLQSLPVHRYTHSSLVAHFLYKLNRGTVSRNYKTEDVLALLSYTDRADYRSKLATAQSNSALALQAEGSGQPDQANEYWRHVFGAYSA